AAARSSACSSRVFSSDCRMLSLVADSYAKGVAQLAIDCLRTGDAGRGDLPSIQDLHMCGTSKEFAHLVISSDTAIRAFQRGCLLPFRSRGDYILAHCKNEVTVPAAYARCGDVASATASRNSRGLYASTA